MTQRTMRTIEVYLTPWYRSRHTRNLVSLGTKGILSSSDDIFDGAFDLKISDDLLIERERERNSINIAVTNQLCQQTRWYTMTFLLANE